MLSGKTIEIRCLQQKDEDRNKILKTESCLSSYGSFNEIMDHSSNSNSNSNNKNNSNNSNSNSNNNGSLRYSRNDSMIGGESCDIVDNIHNHQTESSIHQSDPLAQPSPNETSNNNLFRSASGGTISSNTDLLSWEPIQDRTQSFFSTNTNWTAATADTTTIPMSPAASTESMIIAGSVANLCSATLGAGVLALPYALYQAGIVIGGIMLILSSIATVYSIDLIVMACHTYQIYTYEAVTEYVLGSRMKYYLELAILLFSGGCAVAYVIAVGDILDKSHLLFRNSRAATIILVWLIAMMPLSMCRRMQNLQFASAFGIASIGTLVFAAAVHLFQDVEDHNDDDTIDEQSILLSCLWPANGIVSVLTACPIILFAFSCQCNVCAIFEELPEKVISSVTTCTGQPPCISNERMQSETTIPRSECTAVQGTASVTTTMAVATRDEECSTAFEASSTCHKDILMHKVTIWSVGICAVLYGLVSFLALSDFGQEMTPNMLSSYRPVGVMQVAMSAMAVAVVMAFPLNIFPSRVTIDGWIPESWFARRNHLKGFKDTSTNDEKLFSSSRLQLLSFLRRLSAALRTAFNPTNNNTASERTQLIASPESALPLLVVEHDGVIRSAPSVASFLGSAAPVAADDMTLTTALLHHSEEQLNAVATKFASGAVDDDELNFSWKRHVLLTLFLTGITLALALVLPNISVVFGLLGGTASSFLGFCVPGLLGIHLSHDLFHQSQQEEVESTDVDNIPDTNFTERQQEEQRQRRCINGDNGGSRRTIHNTTTIDVFCSEWKLLLVSWTLLISGICFGIVTTAVTFYTTVLMPAN